MSTLPMNMPPMFGGLPNGVDGLLGNPALQMGLGILANNQGNYGSFGAALGKGGMMGMQNLQRNRMLQMQQMEYEDQRKRREAQDKQEQARREALPRLLGGQQSYMTEQDQPYTRTENVPITAQEGAQAPNFGLQQQTISGINKVPTFDNSKYMQDIVASGYGDKLLEQQLANQFKTKEPLKLGKGDRLYDPVTYKELVSALPDNESSTSLGKMLTEYNALPPNSPLRKVYEQAIRKETTFAPPMTIQNYPAPMAAINPATGQQELVQFGNKGDARPTGFKPVPENLNKAPTEGQAKAATFYNQMTSASNELNKLEQKGYDPTKLSNQLESKLSGGIGNNFISPQSQQAAQAQNQWSESFLRIKTGAAATKDEVNMNVKTFFPQVGDSPDVIQQKARMRTKAEEDVANMTQNPANILSKTSTMSKPRSKAEILKQYGVR